MACPIVPARRLLVLIVLIGTAIHRVASLLPALGSVRLEHVSSGGLLLLDSGGDLVQAPAGRTRPQARPAGPGDPKVVLDPRVGPTVIMGDDPVELPLDRRAQAESHVARSPLNPDLLVAAFQEGRHTDGGAVNVGTALSTNGGLTWTRALLPGITTNVGGTFFRATDPVVAFDARGTVLVNTLGGVLPDFSRTAILLSRSTNNGVRFDPPTLVYQASAASDFADKNWMAVNRFRNSSTAGRIVVSFTLFRSSFSPILTCHSDDGGQTWSEPVYVTGTRANCQGSTPLFLPDGRLAVTYWNFGPSFANAADDTLEVSLSPDGGSTFDPPIVISRLTAFDDPVIRDGYFLPNAAADQRQGHLYITCQGTVAGSPRILFSRSLDQGATWSPLTAVSDNPAGVPVFNPAIDVSADGQVVTILFADKRANPTESLKADYYVAMSFDRGTTWQPNVRVTADSVDLSLAPLTASGRMIGDYFGVAGPVGVSVPLVGAVIGTTAGCPDPIGIRLGVGPELTFDAWRAARFSLAEQVKTGPGSAGSDADGDGFNTMQEYAFGLDPRAPDDARATIARSDPGDGFTIQHPRLKGTTDLEFLWESSTANGEWHEPVPLRSFVNDVPGTTTEQFGAQVLGAASLYEAFRLRARFSP